jgi:hypothetical protein
MKIEENKVQKFWTSAAENAECLQNVPVSLQSVISAFIYVFITDSVFFGNKLCEV